MDWRKSSLSYANGNCLEARALPGGDVEVRNSRDREGPVLRFTADEWKAFIDGARAGEFDDFGGAVTAVPPETPAAPGQAPALEVTHEPEIPVRLVQLWLCDPCLDAEGEQCHTPGCALWINRVPDLPLRGNVFVTVLDDEPGDLRSQLEHAQGQIAAVRALAADVAIHPAKAMLTDSRGRNVFARAVLDQLDPE